MNSTESAFDDGRRIQQAVIRAFAISLRWMIIEDCEGKINRFGPFDSHNEAEFQASQTCYYPYEIVEMQDIRVLNECMGRELQKTEERIKYEKAMKNE